MNEKPVLPHKWHSFTHIINKEISTMYSTRRCFIKTSVLAMASLAAASHAAEPGLPTSSNMLMADPAKSAERKPQVSKRPDIIMVIADQLRQDVLESYGGAMISTPAINRMATEGLVMEHAIAPTPLCSPYRAMLLTGRHPTHNGKLSNFGNISPVQNPNAIAHVMKRAGYDTAFIGKWHLATSEAPFISPGPDRMGFGHWEAYNFHMDFNKYWFQKDTPEKIFSGKYETDTIFDQGLALLKSRNESDKPLFLVMMPHPPHPPFDASALPPERFEGVPERITWSPNVPTKDNPRSTADMRTYLAMCKNFDNNMGRLLDYLAASGRDQKTLVVLSSDHGEMHGSHGRIHKMVPYAESLDVPLIFRWPGVIEPGRSESIFTPLDYLPTLASLVGVPVPTEVDGIDLSRHIFQNEPTPDRAVLIANYSSNWNSLRSDTPETAPDWRCWPEWRGVRSKRHTYVRWLTGKVELYDNEIDPFQLTNLADNQPELCAQFEETLKLLLQKAHDEFLPGTAYRKWYDGPELIRTGLGPVTEAFHLTRQKNENK